MLKEKEAGERLMYLYKKKKKKFKKGKEERKVQRTGDYQVVSERGSRDGLKNIYATTQPLLLPPSRAASMRVAGTERAQPQECQRHLE
jgi:hypothetical protein